MGNKPLGSGVVIEVVKYYSEDDQSTKKYTSQISMGSKIIDKYTFTVNQSCTLKSFRLSSIGEKPAFEGD